MARHRLLLLSLAAGSGHVRAAEAIAAAARQECPEAVIKHIEISRYLDLGLGTGFISSFHLLARYLPFAWKMFYQTTNYRPAHEIFSLLTAPLKPLAARRLYQAITRFGPDHIICTNGIAAQALARPPERFFSPVPFSVVVTDYSFHQYWSAPGASFYFVPTAELRLAVIRETKIASDRVMVSGIPVHPRFYEQREPAALYRSCEIPPGRPMLLVLSGGQGLIDTQRIVSALFSISRPLTVIAVAGQNRGLYRELCRLAAPPHITFGVLGWTDRLDDYLRLAAAVISKPGGLTMAECEVLGRPLIAVSPIPGQEEGNARFLAATGGGAAANSVPEIIERVKDCLDRPQTKPAPETKNTPAARCILRTILSSL
ncbi:MAG: Monogalactosyldiacylglycerol synthase [Candidatus Magasanikbacteria bacterium GW2011_GWA2_56_11]|uniref:Monogalactosyldiacylglycerol synthase n=1 Tax=Candidatus Magasanikbacteria bacterium GW2011_GWA2_56_11 TaxID=1619044 RepID=A0A0G1YHQ9_9BACT|nr:MAG: Monogalactosyldiacylglycerol synthase [Candidatus Magasanikbacteria bacterium GW2011_GWA2_56_11]